jgi:mannose/fructose/N-acetylgalactosamine-specific phosphotransferase system component IID
MGIVTALIISYFVIGALNALSFVIDIATYMRTGKSIFNDVDEELDELISVLPIHLVSLVFMIIVLCDFFAWPLFIEWTEDQAND